MKLINYFLLALVFISSCKEENEESPILSNNYGVGLYIATDNGVSFFDGDTVKNQIYATVNNTTLSNVKRIKFKTTRAYILTDNNLFTANVKTFEKGDWTGGFVDAIDFEFVSPEDRMFVVDMGDSKVKVVNLDVMEITSDIETGDSTKPISIIKNLYRSFVMNGGAIADSLKDSTIFIIDYRDDLVPLADSWGSITIGDNPNSAVWVNNLKVLCKGIYDPNNMDYNTNATLVSVNPLNREVIWTQQLDDVYNAKNLVSDNDDNKYYFTASDGIYSVNSNGTDYTNIINTISDVLYYQEEEYSEVVSDSLTQYYTRNVLYINDSENSKNTIYKYNIDTDQFIDTIIVAGNVSNINFYQ
ncbi:MAG: hypothetical protein CMD16_05010 [Flavobacteriales bacterium]|nr:hypothetical protein [Flavobacteriales bacterium]|tara:strand:+ start:11115 stop:12188 length:1074 start_codon:yes stop_codon:yes gene_type:complete